MRETVKVVRCYESRCGVCKTKYSSTKKGRALKEAKQCASRILEKKVFKLGDPVTNLEPRNCFGGGKSYYFRGRVIKIIGPEPSDYETEVKWLGGKQERVNGHVFQYEVEYICPRCEKTKTMLYYAPELKNINP